MLESVIDGQGGLERPRSVREGQGGLDRVEYSQSVVDSQVGLGRTREGWKVL